jgi:hypothetical protein
VAVTLIAACGGGSDRITDPVASGAKFNATASGAVAASYSGSAIYSVSQSGAGAFGVTMSDPVASAAVSMTRQGGIPAVGTYSVANATDQSQQVQGSFVISYAASSSRVFVSTGGSVSITSVTPGHLKGTFSVTARESCSCASPGTVTLTGSFDAAG